MSHHISAQASGWGQRLSVGFLTLLVATASFVSSFAVSVPFADAAAPTFTVQWKAGQPKVVLIFNEPVSDGATPGMAVAASDFTIAGTDVTAGLSISSVSHQPGNPEVTLTLSGNLAIAGAGEVTIACAASSVFNFSNESCGTSATDLNSVTQDTTGPSISAVELMNPTQVFVELSEPAAAATLIAGNFTLTTSSTTDTSTITSVTIFNDGVRLDATGAVTSFGSGNTVAITSSVTDALGNAASPATVTILPSLSISEVKIGSSTNSKDEFIELYNGGFSTLDLSNVKFHIYDQATTTDTSFSLPSGSTIAPNKFFLITNQSASQTVSSDATYSGTVHLVTNGAVYISLSASANTDVIDKVGWGTSATKEGTAAADIALGTSIERRADFGATTAASMATGGSFALKGNSFDTGNNVFDFVVQSTPGPQNSTSAGEFPWGGGATEGTGDTTAPTVTSSFPMNGTTVPSDMDMVGATFSEAMSSATITTTTVKVTAASASTTNLCQTVTLSGNTVNCNLNPTGTLAAELHTLTITTGVQDVAGNPLASNYTATFTPSATMAFTSSAPPFIRGSSPAHGTNTFPANARKVFVMFSDSMATASFTGKVSLLNLTSNVSTVLTSIAPVTVDETDDTVALDVSGFTFTSGTRYRVVFATGITSSDGVELPATSCPNASCIEFTAAAADATAPTIVGREPAAGATANVGTPFIFIQFDDALDQEYVNTDSVQLLNGTDIVSTSVFYDPAFREIGIELATPFEASATYTVRLAAVGNTTTDPVMNVSGVNLADTDGTANTWHQFTFSTGGADVAAPDVTFATATQNEIMVTFTEAMLESTISNLANWTLQSPVGTNVSLSALAGTTVNWDPGNLTATIHEGISLTSGATFQITAGTGIKDLSGNALSSAKTVGGTVQSSSTAGGMGPGAAFTGDVGGNPANFSGTTFGFVPQPGVMPMNAMAGKTSTYFVNIPISEQVRSNTNSGKIILTFPTGFDVTNAASVTSSFSNTDINGPGPGTVGIQAVTANAQARTITITLTSATRCDTGNTDPCASVAQNAESDFLDFDLSGIVNSSSPRTWDTGAGYSVDIKTMTGTTVNETMTSMPFFINEAGSNTLNVNLTAAGMTSGTVVVRAFAPSTGEMQATANFATNANGTATAAFTGLTNDFYRIWTDPMVSLGGSTDNFQGITNAGTFVNSTTTNYPYTLTSTGSLGTITVNVNGLSGKDLDVMAGGPVGWTMKRISATDGSDTVTLKVASGDWNVAVMPHMPTDGGFVMPKAPDYITSPSYHFVKVNTTPTPDTFEENGVSGDGTVTFTMSSAGLTLPVTVVDASNKTIVGAMVFASDSTNGFGTFGTTNTSGQATLNVVAGTYNVGAALMGAPPSGQKQVRVEADGDIFVGGSSTAVTSVTFKVAKSDYSISGTVTNGTDPVSGAGVHAFCTANCDGYRDAGNMTDSTGSYTLYVGNGTWKVEAFIPGFGPTPQTEVIVSSADQTGINLAPNANLTFNTISGTVCYVAGGGANCSLEGAVGLGGVEIRARSTASGGGENFTQTNDDGTYSLRAPAATGYVLEAFDMKNGRKFPNKTGVSNASGNATAQDIVIDAPRTITINVKDSVGTAVTVADMWVDMVDASTNMGANTMIKNLSQGTVQVPDGSYKVYVHMPGVDLSEATAVVTDDAINTVVTSGTLSVNGNETIKIVLPTLRTVSGTVTDGTTAVADAWVEYSSDTTGMRAGTETASNGTYSISLPDGTYQAAVYAPDVIMTAPITVVVDGTETQNLVGARTTLTISGTITDTSGNPVSQACVEGVRQGGGSTGICVEGNGTYSLPVIAGTWTVTARGYGFQAKAFSTNITVTDTSQTEKNIQFTAAQSGLADPTVKSLTPSDGGTSVDEDLALSVTVPPNAVSTSSSAGTLTLQETNEVGDTTRTDVIGDEAFSVEMTDAGGTPLTSNFTDDLTIEKELSVASLDTLDIDTVAEVEDLTISYYSKGAWFDEPTTATYLDGSGNVVSSPSSDLSNVITIEFSTAVDHLTVFAITRGADGLAPAAPTGVSALGAAGRVTVSWSAVTTNSDSTSITDLAGYELYRSTTSGGTYTQINSSDIIGTSYADTTVSNGTTYFYRVTAGDTGGTESVVSSTVSATPASSQVVGGSGGGGGGGAGSTTPTVSMTVGASGKVGEILPIAWSTGGSGIKYIEVRYSTDGGKTSTQIVDNLVHTSSPYSWTIPSSLSGSVILTVNAYDSGKSKLASAVGTIAVTAVGAAAQDAATSDAQLGIMKDDAGRRVAPASGNLGPSPLNGKTESISKVSAGQFVRAYGYQTVYYITSDMQRRPFWDAMAFMTWAKGWDDVVWVTDATLATLPLGAPMLPKPGVVLVKIQSDAKTYAVDADLGVLGTYKLRWIISEAVAKGRYGAQWADYVVDLEPTTIARYAKGLDLTDETLLDLGAMKTRASVAALAR